jgi:hypothetical protein
MRPARTRVEGRRAGLVAAAEGSPLWAWAGECGLSAAADRAVGEGGTHTSPEGQASSTMGGDVGRRRLQPGGQQPNMEVDRAEGRHARDAFGVRTLRLRASRRQQGRSDLQLRVHLLCEVHGHRPDWAVPQLRRRARGSAGPVRPTLRPGGCRTGQGMKPSPAAALPPRRRQECYRRFEDPVAQFHLGGQDLSSRYHSSLRIHRWRTVGRRRRGWRRSPAAPRPGCVRGCIGGPRGLLCCFVTRPPA